MPVDCGRGWIFFDLGNTLIDTSTADRTRYMPGALEYLRTLKDTGFHLGLITNIPATWGDSDEERVLTLRKEIAKTWDEPDAFEWTAFEAVLVPRTDTERKPAPILFERALVLVPGCSSAYQGEDPREAEAAKRAGFRQAYVVGSDPQAFFAPVGGLLPVKHGK